MAAPGAAPSLEHIAQTDWEPRRAGHGGSGWAMARDMMRWRASSRVASGIRKTTSHHASIRLAGSQRLCSVARIRIGSIASHIVQGAQLRTNAPLVYPSSEAETNLQTQTHAAFAASQPAEHCSSLLPPVRKERKQTPRPQAVMLADSNSARKKRYLVPAQTKREPRNSDTLVRGRPNVGTCLREMALYSRAYGIML